MGRSAARCSGARLVRVGFRVRVGVRVRVRVRLHDAAARAVERLHELACVEVGLVGVRVRVS